MAYCIKCKVKREIKDPVPSQFKNGTPVLMGTCPVCGGKLFEIQKRIKQDKPLKEAVGTVTPSTDTVDEETIEPIEE